MKKFKPALVFGFLGIATFASLVGTISGTLAWYVYNARTTLSYSGTSVENSVQLQIGLMSDNELVIDNDDWNATMAAPEIVNGKYCYFAPLGYGLSSEVINAYLGKMGYATNELAPVTSGYYDPDDPACDFSLKSEPTTEHYASDLPAEKTNYLKLPFIFRATKSKSDTPDYVENQELWLTDAKGAASSSVDGNVYKAMRVFFDREDADYDTDFILNPDAESAGETKVGGLLDLTCDSYYDFDENGEIIYGDWDKTALLDPATKLSSAGWTYTDENPIYDLNNTGNEVTKATTFDSRHHDNTKYYSKEKLDEIPFKTAKYESLSSIRPVRNETNGQLSNPAGKITSVCKTGGAAEHYIGHVDAYIWLEGWDYYVIDEEQQHRFDFGLTFEINKAGNNS